MFKVILIYILIAAVSFFVAKYYYKTPTDTKIECSGRVCPPPKEWEDDRSSR